MPSDNLDNLSMQLVVVAQPTTARDESCAMVHSSVMEEMNLFRGDTILLYPAAAAHHHHAASPPRSTVVVVLQDDTLTTNHTNNDNTTNGGKLFQEEFEDVDVVALSPSVMATLNVFPGQSVMMSHHAPPTGKKKDDDDDDDNIASNMEYSKRVWLLPVKTRESSVITTNNEDNDVDDEKKKKAATENDLIIAFFSEAYRPVSEGDIFVVSPTLTLVVRKVDPSPRGIVAPETKIEIVS